VVVGAIIGQQRALHVCGMFAACSNGRYIRIETILGTEVRITTVA